MLDYQLIQQNSETAAQALRSLWPTPSPDLWHIQNFCDDAAWLKLQQYIATRDESAWQPVPWQENLPRRKITWEMDSVIEELHEVCSNNTQLIVERFGMPLHFHGIQIWRDAPGYQIQEHTDNPIIDVAVQIYLFDAPSHCGTTFFVNATGDEISYVIPHHHNTGYVLVNHSVPHCSTIAVPEGVLRYSFYAHWSQLPKQ
jgi:hypothetical protein